MKLRRFTSYLLTTALFVETCAPVFACEDINKFDGNLLKKGGIPSFSTFKADPNHTAAGCLFYAWNEKKGRFEVLLGHRDDEDSYCNMGGKSDAADGTLDRTGGRESGEESLNIYAPHPEFLKTKPFVDLYSRKKANRNSEELIPFLNRMYFVEQPYVEASIFNKRLKEAKKLGLSHH